MPAYVDPPGEFIEVDVLAGTLGVEEEQLRRDQVRDVVVHLLAEEDDAFAQQARVDSNERS